MKHANNLAILVFFALLVLSAANCSDSNIEKPVTHARMEVAEEVSTVVLEDGVYPVALANDATRNPEANVIELINIPVQGSEDSTPEKIRVIPQPLLRFQTLSRFDFKFTENECTEIGFHNTDELKAYTRDHIGSQLAVVIDNKAISHHKIREAIEGDEVRITCCTVGGGDHLHHHLKELKLASKGQDGLVRLISEACARHHRAISTSWRL
jgi:preprotein translocase subunit SecD